MSCALQESKFRDAIRYYQPLVARHASNLLGVTAIVLANLCVSYIMTSQVSLLVADVCCKRQ
jgi:tetratricopeptide repeat protein 30